MLMATPTTPALAAHGGAVTGVLVEFTGMRVVAAPPDGDGCAVSGAVQNGSNRRVTVRIRYRGQDASGTVAVAMVRLPGVQPSETREFVSPAFPGFLDGCGRIRKVEMIDAVADPEP
jgi:hypothetical protein